MDRKRASGNHNAVRAVDAVGGRAETEAAALNQEPARALDAGAFAGDLNVAGGNVQKRLFPLEVEPFIPGPELQLRIFDAQAVVCVNGVLGRFDADAAAGDDQLVIGVDSVLVCACDRKTAAAVDGEIVAAEENAADIVGCGGFGIRSAAAHAVLRALRERQKNLVRLLCNQARAVLAADIHAVQQEPDLGAAVRADRDTAVGQRARENIAACLGDDDAAVIGIGPASCNHGMIPGEGDPCCAGGIPGTVPVVEREKDGVAASFRVPIHNCFQPEAFAVDEQDREKKRTRKDGNADQINMLVR